MTFSPEAPASKTILEKVKSLFPEITVWSTGVVPIVAVKEPPLIVIVLLQIAVAGVAVMVLPVVPPIMLVILASGVLNPVLKVSPAAKSVFKLPLTTTWVVPTGKVMLPEKETWPLTVPSKVVSKLVVSSAAVPPVDKTVPSVLFKVMLVTSEVEPVPTLSKSKRMLETLTGSP